jgi:glycosyltransferase involved in cell wall biosynthesis
MGRINLLHIYQNSQVGGIQQQILSLIRSYDRELVNPMFCCLGPKKEIGREIEGLGVESHALARIKYNRFSPGIVFDLYRLMKQKDIHVLRTHKYHANQYGRLAAWLAGVPVVIASVHGNYRKDKRLNRRIVNMLLAGVTDRIVAVSDAIEDDIKRYDKINPGKLLVFRNGVDTRIFDPGREFTDIRSALPLRENEIVIGFIGRLVVNKGLLYLMEALSLLKKDYKNLRLMIIGEGSLRGELEDRAKELQLEDRISFLGERRDIPEALYSIDIFAIPSIAEGLPNALLEAMSMARPIVATEVGGIPEVIKNRESGLLVKPKDPGGLAEAIKTLITDSRAADEMGRNARDFVESNYSITANARRWEELYRALLTEKSVNF